jgi:hypothetical protein
MREPAVISALHAGHALGHHSLDPRVAAQSRDGLLAARPGWKRAQGSAQRIG